MALIKQKISNHKTFADVEREVEIVGFSVDNVSKRIQIFTSIKYEKNGNDVSKTLSPEIGDWVIDNTYTVSVRDENLQPVQNPDWKEEDGEENKYLKVNAYDYFKDLVFNKGTNIKTALQNYIRIDDEHGRFDL